MNRLPVVIHESGRPDARPLVFLHGVTDDGQSWPDAVARWSADWWVIGVDLRGHGLSPRFEPEERTRMMEVFVEDLIDILGALPTPAAVVGHSLGGRIAALAAVQRPELFAGLVLEDPAIWSGYGLSLAANRQRHDEVAATQANPAAARARLADETSWSDAELDAWAASKVRVDLDMLLEMDLGPVDPAEVFNALRKPTLVLWDADGNLACDRAILANDLVRFEYLDDIGHCMRRDDPERFHGFVDPWLENLQTGQPSS